jgi:multidrug efflux pump subunit AcrA (membrane-fusion protein)
VVKLLIGMIFISAFSGCKNEGKHYPRRKDIMETVYASGKILADSEYMVYALNPGTVTEKLVKEGDQVKQGSALYLIRNTGPAARSAAADDIFRNAQENLSSNSRVLNDLKITMRNADLRYRNDSLLYSRYRNLWAQDIGTKVNLDNAQTQCQISNNDRNAAREKYFAAVNDLRVTLKSAQSQAISARADLANYTIRAESSGMVYQTLKENGEAVKTNEAVALMGKPGSRIIRLEVDQQDVDKIRTGQTVLLKTDVSGEQVFKAAITRIYPVMNEADQTFRVDAVFTGAVSQSFIHSSVEANIVIRYKRNCLVLPNTVLLAGDSLIIKQNGRKTTIAVKTGIHTMDEVEILSGINLQSEVIDPVK